MANQFDCGIAEDPVDHIEEAFGFFEIFGISFCLITCFGMVNFNIY